MYVSRNIYIYIYIIKDDSYLELRFYKAFLFISDISQMKKKAA